MMMTKKSRAPSHRQSTNLLWWADGLGERSIRNIVNADARSPLVRITIPIFDAKMVDWSIVRLPMEDKMSVELELLGRDSAAVVTLEDSHQIAKS